MIIREVLLDMFNEWVDELDNSIQGREGKRVCEATRMLLSLLSMLHAYFPYVVTPEMCRVAEDCIARGLEYVAHELEGGNNPDGYYDLYRDNIEDRLSTIRHLLGSWFAATSDKETSVR
jgi:hypothetical protein